MTRQTTGVDQAIEEMIDAARSFHARGWMLGTSGNLSVVTSGSPLRFHVSVSGRDKGRLTPADFIEVDASGVAVAEGAPRPSAETALHAEIYRLTNAGAVYHVHQVHAALCSTLGESAGCVELRDLEMIKGLNIWDPDAVVKVPVVPNHADIPQLARAAGEALVADVPGVLICRHGLYAWGATPFEARRHVEVFDYLFEYRYKAALLGLTPR